YSFVESLQASYPFYFIRFVGGAIFLSGMFLMAYNAYKTIYEPKASLKAIEEQPA
ncbi:cytochrome C oxidase Cbb3, partial [Photobacterium damselae]